MAKIQPETDDFETKISIVRKLYQEYFPNATKIPVFSFVNSMSISKGFKESEQFQQYSFEVNISLFFNILNKNKQFNMSISTINGNINYLFEFNLAQCKNIFNGIETSNFNCGGQTNIHTGSQRFIRMIMIDSDSYWTIPEDDKLSKIILDRESNSILSKSYNDLETEIMIGIDKKNEKINLDRKNMKLEEGLKLKCRIVKVRFNYPIMGKHAMEESDASIKDYLFRYPIIQRKDMIQDEWRRKAKELKDKLLYKVYTVQSDYLPNAKQIAILDDSVVSNLICQHCQEASWKTDVNDVPVHKTLLSAYKKGILIKPHDRFTQKDCNDLQKSSSLKLQYIFHKISCFSDQLKRKIITELVDNWNECEIGKTQVVDNIYARLSGQEGTLKRQLENLLQHYKRHVLYEVAIRVYPMLDYETRIPHLYNGLKFMFAHKIGLDATDSTNKDKYMIHEITDTTICEKINGILYKVFDPYEFAEFVVTDVNLDKKYISDDSLFEWCRTLDKVEIDILYDEDKKNLYCHEPKDKDVLSMMKPFLHIGAAIDIINHVFEYKM